jgi:hypothetical protein
VRPSRAPTCSPSSSVVTTIETAGCLTAPTEPGPVIKWPRYYTRTASHEKSSASSSRLSSRSACALIGAIANPFPRGPRTNPLIMEFQSAPRSSIQLEKRSSSAKSAANYCRIALTVHHRVHRRAGLHLPWQPPTTRPLGRNQQPHNPAPSTRGPHHDHSHGQQASWHLIFPGAPLGQWRRRCPHPWKGDPCFRSRWRRCR